MQEKHLFEYAVIRLMPRVEREEFLNVGVILFSSSERFLETRFYLDEQRLRLFYGTINITELEERLRSFQQVCAGGDLGGPIGKLPLASRFRWLSATRSTVIQISAVHPGLCSNAAETLEKLYLQLVL